MSELKFGRTFRIEIDLGDGNPIVITSPLTAQFTVNRRQLSSLNECTIDLYNLSKKSRDLIFQEFYSPSRDKKIKIQAGYGTLSTLYQGDIFEAYNRREGTNIITTITSLSGYWEVDNRQVYTTLSDAKSVKDVLLFLTGQFEDLEIGAIGDYNTPINHPVVLNGNVWDLIRTYSNDEAFIDNGRVYILRENEVIQGSYPVINKDTGILDTPRRDGGFIRIRTLFEPRIQIGQIIAVDSLIEPIYNASYMVVGVQHTGTISGAVGGSCETMVDLLVGNNVFTVVRDE